MAESVEKIDIAELERKIAELKVQLENVHGTECEVYARIVGYYRAVKNWNKGKKDEYGIRTLFDKGHGEKEGFTDKDKAALLNKDEQIAGLDEHCDSCAIQPVSLPKTAGRVESKAESKAAGGVQREYFTYKGMTYKLYYKTTCPHCPAVKERMQGVEGGLMA